MIGDAIQRYLGTSMLRYRFSTSTFRLTSLTNSVTQFSTEADLEQVTIMIITAFLGDFDQTALSS